MFLLLLKYFTDFIINKNVFTDVFQEDETCLSTHTRDAWITALAWSGTQTKNSYDFYPQYLLVGGVDGSVIVATVNSLNKITYEQLNEFSRPGGLYFIILK